MAAAVDAANCAILSDQRIIDFIDDGGEVLWFIGIFLFLVFGLREKYLLSCGMLGVLRFPAEAVQLSGRLRRISSPLYLVPGWRLIAKITREFIG